LYFTDTVFGNTRMVLIGDSQATIIVL